MEILVLASTAMVQSTEMPHMTLVVSAVETMPASIARELQMAAHLWMIVETVNQLELLFQLTTVTTQRTTAPASKTAILKWMLVVIFSLVE